MEANDRLEVILKGEKLKIPSFVKMLGEDKYYPVLYDIKNGKLKSFSEDLALLISQKTDFPYDWIIGDVEDFEMPEKDHLKDALNQLNKKTSGRERQIAKRENIFNTVEAYVLPVKGRLGLGSTYYSDSYFENELQKIKIPIRDKPSNINRFILAEFEGESMTDGSEDEIPAKSWVLLGEKNKESWNDKMKGKIMGFFDRKKNFTLKKVKEHDQHFETVILEALNPDKEDEDNQDRKLDISDCWAIYEYLGTQTY